jgi:DNA-binding protein WhiA
VARLFRALQDEPAAFPVLKTAHRRPAGLPDYEVALSRSRAGSNPRARCDRRMELRGAFLACGSLALPASGYHLEFLPPGDEPAERLRSLLAAEGHTPKLARRRGKPLVYFKHVDAIVAVLAAIGAHGAILRIEDVRALKETKNRVRRLVNTEAANVDRAAKAAARQCEAIAFLADAYGLQNLSSALREVAALRAAHPAETLAEIGRRCSPRIGKSTVNGRIGALLRLSETLRRNGRRAGEPR